MEGKRKEWGNGEVSGEKGSQYRFRDLKPEEYSRPDINPYLKLHREYGPPVLTASEAKAHRGRWSEAFGGREAPIHVEIGPGNGFFLAGMAGKHPDQNWLGLEIRFKRVVLCAKKIQAAGVENARIARYDAWFLEDLFGPGEIDCLYVNFPDPWMRERDEKKRLMGPAFAAWAVRSLKPGGLLRLKSDHGPNLDRLIAGFESHPMEVLGRSDDVAAQGTPWPAEDDIITNYQSKFIAKGEPIHALLMHRQSD